MTKENAIKIVNDYFNKQFVPIDLSEAIDILTAVPPVSQKFVEPSKKLNKAAEEYAYTNWESEDYHEGASEGMSFDPIGHTEKCFKAGAEWQREQMLKDAIEGIARPDDCEIWVNLKGYDYNYKDGDKVKLIIVKEKEK